jgi:hypothetical protein
MNTKYNQPNVEYNQEYDAYYNSVNDEWIEDKCSDPDCFYCPSRPEKPSMVAERG